MIEATTAQERLVDGTESVAPVQAAAPAQEVRITRRSSPYEGLSEQPQVDIRKAELALKITEIIEARGWTQKQAADIMGIDQPKVSQLKRGRLSGFGLDRLVTYLDRLGQEVSITVTPKQVEQAKIFRYTIGASSGSRFIGYSQRTKSGRITYDRWRPSESAPRVSQGRALAKRSPVTRDRQSAHAVWRDTL